MIDEIFVLYENSGKYFKTYNQAYFNSKKPFAKKVINYIHTPTFTPHRRVSELEQYHRNYLENHFDCTYLNLSSKILSKQLSFLGE